MSFCYLKHINDSSSLRMKFQNKEEAPSIVPCGHNLGFLSGMGAEDAFNGK